MRPNPPTGPGNLSRVAANDGIGADLAGAMGANLPGTPPQAYRSGMVVGLAAICMFFMALVSASVVRRGSPSGDWQPLAATPAIWRILWVNTIVLLASSAALARSRSRFRAGNEREFRWWWCATAILGAAFLAGQWIAWRKLAIAGVYLATNPSSSFFYLLTAAHGVHLLGGIAGLLVVGFRSLRRVPRRAAIDAAGIYWHFMDGVWIMVFLFLLAGRG